MSGEKNPCQGCLDRYTACSDHCRKPELLAWQARQEAIRQARRKDNEAWAYSAEQIRKNRRRR